MKSAGKARSYGLYRHIRTSNEIIGNLLNDLQNNTGKAVLNKNRIFLSDFLNVRFFLYRKTPY